MTFRKHIKNLKENLGKITAGKKGKSNINSWLTINTISFGR